MPTGQPQHVYHFQDGTLIRLKPDGDDKNGPKAGYSVEVLKPNLQQLSGQDDVAFKVGASGQAVPKGPGDTANPYQTNAGYQIQQYNTFNETVMAAGHRHAAT